VPALGQELTDPDTGASLRFVRTAKSSEGESTVLTLGVLRGWSAGPLHVHPLQSERMRVVEGVFQLRRGKDERTLRAGDRIEVVPKTAHTIALVGEAGTLEAEFAPALRTDELFETMFSATWPRRPPGFVPAALRAWVESRGFEDEIRYLWPRRVGGLFAAMAALTLLQDLLRRRRRRCRKGGSLRSVCFGESTASKRQR
jgi:mannose-6-phosphate isomerase-like protein (cupin superfamily)